MHRPISRSCSRVVVGAAALAALLLASQVQAQTTYRWVDKQGRVHYSDQPPSSAEAQDVKQKQLHVAKPATDSAAALALQAAAQKNPLTLYVSPDCKEGCMMARDFLKRRGLPFSEKSVQTFEDAAEFQKATGLKDLFVPVLQAGSKVEKGFEENAWQRLLETAGYPKQTTSDSAKGGAMGEEKAAPKPY